MIVTWELDANSRNPETIDELEYTWLFVTLIFIAITIEESSMIPLETTFA